ncbi:MAG: hypothetical protein NT004_19410 [Bacteroidetes bacterium]|nr:hypothetical protein [Bacteroidota bacterium]
MFEKERTRLKSEEIRILLRLEFIQGRLKEIQDHYDQQAILMHTPEPSDSAPKKTEEAKSDFKTMSIDY